MNSWADFPFDFDVCLLVMQLNEGHDSDVIVIQIGTALVGLNSTTA